MSGKITARKLCRMTSMSSRINSKRMDDNDACDMEDYFAEDKVTHKSYTQARLDQNNQLS